MAFKTLSYYTEIYQLRIVVLKSSNGYYEENTYLKTLKGIKNQKVLMKDSNLLKEKIAEFNAVKKINKNRISSDNIGFWGDVEIKPGISKKYLAYTEFITDRKNNIIGFVEFDLLLNKLVEKLRNFSYREVGKFYNDFPINILFDSFYQNIWLKLNSGSNSKNLGYAFIISETGQSISNPMLDERRPNYQWMGDILLSQSKELASKVIEMRISQRKIINDINEVKNNDINDIKTKSKKIKDLNDKLKNSISSEFIDPFTYKKSYMFLSVIILENIRFSPPQDWIIAVVYYDEMFTPYRNFINTLFFLISLIFILIIIILIYKTSGSLTSPLEKLVKQSEAYSSGDFKAHLDDDKGTLEIVKLSKAFNVMGDEISHQIRQLNDTQLELVFYLSKAAEYRDTDTGMHLKRISEYSRLLAQKLGMDKEEINNIYHASALHDIGKIGIKDSILLKEGPLNDKERKIMQTHTIIGKKMLEGSKSPLLQMGSLIAGNHHEKWDGTGYPEGKKHDEIPIVARIVAICDVFDALISKRVYKDEWTMDDAINEIHKLSGTHFDPDLVDKFIELMPIIVKIKDKFRE
jgi:HD-GYP domain-containing protein (c-di-GMP phosphodiesterase class II)